ncbi:MAG: outer membrane lipoprotein-sorting protein [Myxococcota bacterium]
MKPLHLVGLTGLLAASPAWAEDAAARGLEIAQKLDAANEGFESDVSSVEMTLINAHGDQVERKMTIEIIEGEKDGDKSVVAFSFPADVDGTKLLTWTHKSDNDDQWLYMPAIKRIKRISSRSKSGSFMGSEFSYEDMSSQEVEKYTYKFLGEDTLEGRTVWKLERVPVGDSGYSRQVGFYDKEYMNPLRIEYFDKKDELLKVGTFTGYKKFGEMWRVGTIEMSNEQTRKRSVLVWKTRTLGEDLDPEDFESDALED